MLTEQAPRSRRYQAPERLLLGLLCAVLAYSLVSMPLAMIGALLPLPALPAALIVAVVLYRWIPEGAHVERLPSRTRWSAIDRSEAVSLVVLILLVVGFVWWNAALSSEHLRVDRDPGVYVTTGRWLARDGSLFVDGAVGPFADTLQLRFAGAGFYGGAPDGQLYAQFLHLLPAFLAAGHWFGGVGGLLATNAVLAGVALLSIHGFAVRLLRSRFALVAVAAVAANLAQIYFSRDAFSEILTQIFVFGGLWALWVSREMGSRRWAFFAGMLLGATCMTRVDAFVYLIPLSLYLGIEAVRWPASRAERAGGHIASPGVVAATATGLGTTTLLGLLDATVFARPDLRDLGWQITAVFAAVVVVAALTLFIVAARRRLLGLGRWLADRREVLGRAALLLIVAVALYAWFIRPHVEYHEWSTRKPAVEGLTEGLQILEGLEVNGRHTYAEVAMPRLGAYTGFVAMSFGVVGFAGACAAALRRRDVRYLPLIGLFGFVTVLYIWRPSITPDQIWVMRRYLPVTVPGLVLFAALALKSMWTRAGGRLAGRVAVRIAAVAIVLQPLLVSMPLIGVREYVPLRHLVDNLCRTLGTATAAVIVEDGSLHRSMPQTLSAFCGWPVAIAPADLSAIDYIDLAKRWAAEGRRLAILSNGANPVPDATPGEFESVLVVEAALPVVERTLSTPPDESSVTVLTVYLTTVPRDP